MDTEQIPDLTDPANWPKVNPADITIREAADLVADGESFYLAHMPGVLRMYPGITVAAYWELRVCEHQTLIDYIEQTTTEV